jgi:carboxylesterase type B
LGNCALYNGTTFAQNNVVTVVINYRLGALGFMASQSMEGNYGFTDQILALKWVRDNVASFGGDPKQVTIGGQSAGAMSVSCHLISKESAGLFSAAIMESNPLGMPYHSRKTAQANADAVFEYVGCAADDVACMKTKTTDEILDAQNHAIKLNARNLFINFLPFAPMVEETGVIPDQPLTALAKGQLTSPVPILSGTVHDEGQLFVYELFTGTMKKVAYEATVTAVFGKESDQILAKYPFDLIPGNTDGESGTNTFRNPIFSSSFILIIFILQAAVFSTFWPRTCFSTVRW